MLNSYDRMKKDKNIWHQQLGQLIKSERQSKNLTQTELGDISETSINFISQIESGKSTAQIGKVLRVLQVLGIELHCSRGSKGLVIPQIILKEK